MMREGNRDYRMKAFVDPESASSGFRSIEGRFFVKTFY